MHMQDLIGGIEAILFASANPMTEAELKKVVARWLASLPVEPASQEANIEAEAAGPAAQSDDAPGLDRASDTGGNNRDGNAVAPQISHEASIQAAGVHDDMPPAPVALADDAATELPSEAAADHSGQAAAASAPAAHEASGQSGACEPGAQKGAPETLQLAAADLPDAPAAAVALEAPDAGQLPEITCNTGAFDWRKNFKAAIAAVKMRWQDPPECCGFTLVEVAEALTFRSNARFAPALLALRDEKPLRLSRAAMETLAIIAYRQPVTKPESDHIRGVDCGGTIKMLLERNLIRIVGKKEEAGRPLLYGTGPEFLSFFNLASVHQLPSLRAFDELNDDSEEALRELDSLPSLQELSAQAKQFRLDDEPAMGSLDAAVDALRRTESTSREALAAQGICLATDEDDKPVALEAPPPTQH